MLLVESARVALIGSSLGGLTACRVAEQDPRVAAIDFVELDPNRDVAEITTRTFASAILTFLAGLFLRLNDDGAKKVLGIRGRLNEPEFSQPPHVLPERLPLRLLFPHVRTLERGHNEMLRLPAAAGPAHKLGGHAGPG